MTVTRIKIIELIEPFMEKELVEGCLLFNNRLKSKKISKIVRNKYGWISFISNDSHSIYKEGQIGFEKYHKVLGHYSITAVLKYIRMSNKTLIGKTDCHSKDFYIEMKKGQEYIIFPNKPLHLYTEQEEKSLLELLKKLGQEKGGYIL